MKVEVGWSLLSYGPLSAMTVFRFLALLPSISIYRPQPNDPHSQHLSGLEHYALFGCLDNSEKENWYRLVFLGLAMFTALSVAPYHVRWDSQETLSTSQWCSSSAQIYRSHTGYRTDSKRVCSVGAGNLH
jgi:hypothetical protein